ncbi:MAG: DUF1824 family protein [Leptolyngbya sp.]|nr:DUF1824 family protein [Leptolyngbya sp.]
MSDLETLKAHRKALAPFSCDQVPRSLTDAERAAVRASLLLFNECSDYQTLGICADDLPSAVQALKSYATALGCPELKLNGGDGSSGLLSDHRSGPVYLKFNTLKGAWYLDDYSGPSRGVLVSYHASEPEADPVNGTYGPFPLNLFLAEH